MLRTKLAELLIHSFEANGVEVGFEAKMAGAALEFEHFELGVGQHSGQKVRGQRGQRFFGKS